MKFIHGIWGANSYISYQILKSGEQYLRGYCTPDQFFDCLCIFLKNYNTLVASKVCFL